MKLSVLICSLESRKVARTALLASLDKQRKGVGVGVEILTSVDGGQAPIGHKRNVLLGAATGEYACFVDDDDTVAPNYLQLLTDACCSNLDCVGIVGEILWQGKKRRFTHSIRHDKYHATTDEFFRPPNHLNPIRTSIAKAYKFPELDFGEDFDWAMQLVKAKALKTEQFVDQPLYFYWPSKGDGT